MVTIIENNALEKLGIKENGFEIAKTFKAYDPYTHNIQKCFRLPINKSDWVSLNGKYRIYDNVGK